MMQKGNRGLLPLAAVVAAVALSGCVDEEVVFEDRGIYDRIPEEALGFVGYADPSDNDMLTVCGYCHGDYQASWEGTAHANTWIEGEAPDAFKQRSSTNSLGNVVPEDEAGATGGSMAGVNTERYLDVQCESCHGPGLEHATGPADANAPPAPVNVLGALTDGCAACHTSPSRPFTEEWSASAHGNLTRAAAVRGVTAGACNSCHTGEGGLARLGVTSDYLEQDDLAGDDVYMQITCAVCHDPHSAQNQGQLRFPIAVENPADHLCAQCHDRQTAPDTEGNQDWLQPHSPETALLAGTAGWFPDGASLTPGSETGPHGASSNPTLCSSCHGVAYTSDAGYNSWGHGFRAAPCVDAATGIPSGDVGCALTTTARAFQGCATGECHGGSADAAATALNGAVDRILGHAETLDGYLDDLTAAGEINARDGRFTAAEGGLFNLRLATNNVAFRPNQSTEERRRALAAAVTHNGDFIEALLVETLDALEAAYPGVVPDPVPGPQPVSR